MHSQCTSIRYQLRQDNPVIQGRKEISHNWYKPNKGNPVPSSKAVGGVATAEMLKFWSPNLAVNLVETIKTAQPPRSILTASICPPRCKPLARRFPLPRLKDVRKNWRAQRKTQFHNRQPHDAKVLRKAKKGSLCSNGYRTLHFSKRKRLMMTSRSSSRSRRSRPLTSLERTIRSSPLHPLNRQVTSSLLLARSSVSPKPSGTSSAK